MVSSSFPPLLFCSCFLVLNFAVKICGFCVFWVGSEWLRPVVHPAIGPNRHLPVGSGHSRSGFQSRQGAQGFTQQLLSYSSSLLLGQGRSSSSSNRDGGSVCRGGVLVKMVWGTPQLAARSQARASRVHLAQRPLIRRAGPGGCFIPPSLPRLFPAATSPAVFATSLSCSHVSGCAELPFGKTIHFFFLKQQKCQRRCSPLSDLARFHYKSEGKACLEGDGKTSYTHKSFKLRALTPPFSLMSNSSNTNQLCR